MRVIVNLPWFKRAGGVTNHYSGLRDYWSEDIVYNEVGGRHSLPGLLLLPFDILKFLMLCGFFRYDCVLLNPSLGVTAILRDALFLNVAKLFGIKVVVFFHGWNPDNDKRISLYPTFFRKLYGRADSFIVLAKEYSEKLRKWGFKQPVFLSTTKVDDKLIQGFDVNSKAYASSLLFLARVEESKGIFIAIDAFSRVLLKHPDARLIVAGSGSKLDEAKDLVKSGAIRNVQFHGNVSGQELVSVFRDSDIYILPTLHEGMPTSVLEAMAFGLPVITRSVGGLNDFFEDGRMGFLSDSLDGDWFAEVISGLLADKDRMRRIGTYNHGYAKEHFLGSKVAAQLEAIVRS